MRATSFYVHTIAPAIHRDVAVHPGRSNALA